MNNTEELLQSLEAKLLDLNSRTLEGQFSYKKEDTVFNAQEYMRIYYINHGKAPDLKTVWEKIKGWKNVNTGEDPVFVDLLQLWLSSTLYDNLANVLLEDLKSAKSDITIAEFKAFFNDSYSSTYGVDFEPKNETFEGPYISSYRKKDAGIDYNTETVEIFKTLFSKRLVEELNRWETAMSNVDTERIMSNAQSLSVTAGKVVENNERKKDLYRVTIDRIKKFREDHDDSFDISDPEDKKQEIKFVITENGEPVRYFEGMEVELFDQVGLNDYIPCVILNNERIKNKDHKAGIAMNNRLFKILSNMDPNTIDKFESNKWFNDQEGNSIILHVWKHSSVPSKSYNPENYITVKYSFHDSFEDVQTFNINVMNMKYMNNIFETLNKYLGVYNVKVSGTKEKEFVQTFAVPDVVVDKNIFLHVLNTDPNFSECYMNEDDYVWSMKKHFKIRVGNFGRFNIANMTSDTILNWMSFEGEQKALYKDDVYAKITITTKFGEDFQERLMYIRYVVIAAFRAYIKGYSDIADAYSKCFSPPHSWKKIKPLNIASRNKRKKLDYNTNDSNPNIRALQRLDADFWRFSNYSKVANKPDHQVKPIKAEEVEYYRDVLNYDVILWPTTVIGDNVENLQAEQGTPARRNMNGDPIQHYYTASSPDKPRIKLVLSKSTKLKDRFPLIPKCQSMPAITVNDDWTINFNFKSNKSSNSTTTLKIRGEGETIAITSSIFGNIFPQSDITLHGVQKSPVSLIEACIQAHESDEDAATVLSSVEESLHVSAEQNPGLSLEDIQQKFENAKETHLDSKDFFAELENYFECHIFTFVVHNDTKFKKKEFLMATDNQVMREKRFDCAVLMVKLFSKSGKGQYHYIRASGIDGKMKRTSVFGEDAVNKLFQLHEALTRQVTLENIIVDGNRETKVEIEKPSPSSKFLKKVESVFYDIKNRVRGGIAGHKGKNLYFLTNYLPDRQNFEITDNLERNDYELVMQMLKDMKIKHIRYTPKFVNGVVKLQGVWAIFNTEDITKVFFPIGSGDLLVDFDEDVMTPVEYDSFDIPSSEESPTQALLRLQKVVNVLMQVIKRLFVLYEDRNVAEFMKNVFVIDDEMKLSIEGGERRHSVPQYIRSFKTLKDYFEKQFPRMFKQGKLVVPDKVTWSKLRTRLIFFADLIEKEKEMTLGYQVILGEKQFETSRVTTFPPHLTNFFQNSQDFRITAPSQMVIMNSDHMKVVQSTLDVEKGFQVVKKKDLTISKMPKFFTRKGKLYMLQNVFDGSRMRAINAAVLWKVSRINTGFYTSEIDRDVKDVQVLTMDNLDIDEEKITILEVSPGMFGAILKI